LSWRHTTHSQSNRFPRKLANIRSQTQKIEISAGRENSLHREKGLKDGSRLSRQPPHVNENMTNISHTLSIETTKQFSLPGNERTTQTQFPVIIATEASETRRKQLAPMEYTWGTLKIRKNSC